MNPLNSIPAAIVSGVVLAIIVFVIIPGSGFNEFSLARWLHILSCIMWVGLLFYVNVAQILGLAAAASSRPAKALTSARSHSIRGSIDGVTEGGGTPIGHYLSDRSWSSKWAIDAKYR